MALKRNPVPPRRNLPPPDRQEEVRRTMQNLLAGLAGRLPAQQPAFQTAFLLNFHRASQHSHPSKGDLRHGRS